jgi:hypothetical protein
MSIFESSGESTGNLSLVLISGTCCFPGMAAFDEQAQHIIEQAIAQTKIPVSVQTIPISAAYYGTVPQPIVAQIMEQANQSARLPFPTILLNGTPISFGVPTLEEMISTLRQTQEKQRIDEERSLEV